MDKLGQGEGGGQKSRKFCGHHMYMAPYLRQNCDSTVDLSQRVERDSNFFGPSAEVRVTQFGLRLVVLADQEEGGSVVQFPGGMLVNHILGEVKTLRDVPGEIFVCLVVVIVVANRRRI